MSESDIYACPQCPNLLKYSKLATAHQPYCKFVLQSQLPFIVVYWKTLVLLFQSSLLNLLLDHTLYITKYLHLYICRLQNDCIRIKGATAVFKGFEHVLLEEEGWQTCKEVTYEILLEKLPQSPTPNDRDALRQCSKPGLCGRTDGQQNGQKLEQPMSAVGTKLS